MALMKCADCGASVSTLAGTCPQCGAPIGRTEDKLAARSSARLSFNLSVLILGIVAAVGIAAWFYIPELLERRSRVEIKVTGSMVPATIAYSTRMAGYGQTTDEFVPPKSFHLGDLEDGASIYVSARLKDEGDIRVTVTNAHTKEVLFDEERSGDHAGFTDQRVECCGK